MTNPKIEKEYKNVLMEFKKDICDKAEEIDPNEEIDWKDMSIGYFIAKGIDINIAIDLACIARYDYGYWQSSPQIKQISENQFEMQL